MNCSHVGHDCTVGNDVIFATSATLGGHCEIGDFVFIGGLSAVHQFGRDRLAGDDRRRLRRAQRRDSVRPCQRPVRQPRRPQHHRHEAPQVHAASGSLTVRSFYQKLFHGPGVFADRLNEVQQLADDRSGDRGNPDLHRCRKTSRTVSAGQNRQQALMRAVNRVPLAGRCSGVSHDGSGLADFIAGRPDCGRRRHAVRGRGFPDRARHQSRCVCVEGRLRSAVPSNAFAITGFRSVRSAGR